MNNDILVMNYQMNVYQCIWCGYNCYLCTCMCVLVLYKLSCLSDVIMVEGTCKQS